MGGSTSGRGDGEALGGAAAGSGGAAPIASGAASASAGATSGVAGPVGLGASPGLGGGAGGANDAAGNGSGDGVAGDGDGAGPVVPPCDPCPCSTGQFAEPELVAGLDTGVPTFGPAPSADGLTLFFSSIRTTEDIFFATRSTRANGFSSVTAVDGVNGVDTEEGTPFISSDARSLFLFSTRPDPSAPGDRDLWISTRSEGSGAFSEPTLVPDVNSNDLDHLPRLTPDGLTLMFVSGRDTDNLFSNILQARRASLAQPFGEPTELPGVNSDSRDEGFSLSADGLTIFFASNRVAEAGMDIWVATRASVDSAFDEAQNLDVVNTPDEDLDPALTLDGFELFFASDRSGTMQLYRSARQCD
jgi:Tol biopolymer transport system component